MIITHTFTIPIRTVSEANSSEHWSKKSARHKKQKKWVRIYMNGKGIHPPCHIKLTRIAPRKLDKDDNLPTSFKYIKDYIADVIKPGLAPGRADDDETITWDYAQEKGLPNTYGFRVEISKL